MLLCGNFSLLSFVNKNTSWFLLRKTLAHPRPCSCSERHHAACGLQCGEGTFDHFIIGFTIWGEKAEAMCVFCGEHDHVLSSLLRYINIYYITFNFFYYFFGWVIFIHLVFQLREPSLLGSVAELPSWGWLCLCIFPLSIGENILSTKPVFH